jgi:diacylglycerol kinase (ATP)
VGILARPLLALLIRRALLITNPASRRAARLRGTAEQAFAKLGVELTVAETRYAGHAGEIAAARGGEYDAVFTLGGDGTAMEAATALSGSGVPIGVLPGGTGNLLARAVGTPLRIGRAVGALLDGEIRRIDLGRFRPGDTRFAIAAGVGIDASMVERTPVRLKRRFGVMAYVATASRAALSAVIRRDFFTLRLTVDGKVEERRAVAVMIANFGAVLNDRITFGPGIQVDDGVLDACVYSPANLREALGIMWRLLRKDFRSHRSSIYLSGRHIRVETDPPRTYQADGELLGTTPFEVEVEPLAATLLVPRR